MEVDIIHALYAEEQTKVAQRIQEIMAAVQEQDLDLLESYHLWGPKFTKYDDWEPLERQDAETTRRVEREGIGGAKAITASASQLKVDVFGRMAIATFVFDYEITLDTDERVAAKARSTMVFVKDGSEWLITHEHLSAFKANL